MAISFTDMEQDNAVDWGAVRAQFPVLNQEVNGKPLAYLDSAASSQMPQPVLDTLVNYHSTTHSNVHRGVHTLSQRATEAFEDARHKVRAFINAPHENQCIFVRGATEGINLVMNTWGVQNIGEGDQILVSTMEHHSNIVPWQMLAKRVGAKVIPIPITDDGELDLDAYKALLNDRVKLVCVVYVSNAMGTINPAQQVIELAHSVGARVMLDACQATPHIAIDVQALNVDFMAFSGHKMYAPTGIGVLYGKWDLLESMPPWMGGGDMIETVSFDGTTYAELPNKFEAGTPSIAAAVGLGAAIDFVTSIGLEHIARREHELLAMATDAFLSNVPNGRIIGTAKNKAAVLSFTIDGIHPHDIGTILDSCGVAVRSGQHCTEPLMTRFGILATARASFGIYSNEQDIQAFIDGLELARDLLA